MQAIAQHANLVEGKDVRNVLAIARQVLVVGFLYLHGGVLQFDEDHWQTIDKEQHVGTAIAIMTFNPHLVDAMEVIPFGMVEVEESHDVEVFLAILLYRHLDAIAYLLIEAIVGVYHVRARKVLAEFLEDAFQSVLHYLWIESLQGSQEHIRQNALRWISTTCRQDLVLSLHSCVTLYSLPSVFGK